MSVCGKINAGALWDCSQKDTGGIEQGEILLINRGDIDLSATVVTRDATNKIHKISKLQLVTGAKAYSFQGINSKRILSASYAKQDGDFLDTVSHTVNIAIYNQCEESLVTLNQFIDGAEVVAVIENKSKGTNNECAFQIYGFDRGLKAGEISYNSNENNGIVLLPLTSREPDFEPYVPYNYLETNYATTKTKVESLKTPQP